jgi:hypothetical protein
MCLHASCIRLFDHLKNTCQPSNLISFVFFFTLVQLLGNHGRLEKRAPGQAFLEAVA